ncbi:MAG: HD domain-containing protein [Halanaerobiales bacterium]
MEKAHTTIKECSFSKGIVPEFLEAKILQDADRLEATGIISIMRTYSSAGQMNTKFYHPEDPFCENREPEREKYALDLFYTRLLLVGEQMHTDTAGKIAEKRTESLRRFLQNFSRELCEYRVLH